MSAVAPEPVATPRLRAGVTPRAIAIAFLLTPLNVLFMVRGGMMWGGVTGDMSLFSNTVGGLFLGVLVNAWLRRHRPRWVFSAGELITIYVVLALGTGLTCSIWDVGGAASIYMTHPFWFATPQNHWQEAVWPNLPTWLTVRDPAGLEGLYYGQANPYTLAVLQAWVAPAVMWTLLVSTIMWVGLCMNSILRRRWADEERLAFPLTVLPVQLADERYSLLTSRLFWLGTGIAGGISIWNTLGGLFPALPHIPLGWDFSTLIANNRPWNFLRFPGIYWDPFSIGATYLIPLDLAFSIFVFGTIWGLQYVVFGYLGWCVSSWSGFPYGEQQTAGGFIALALVTLWLDRGFLTRVGLRALGLHPPLPNEKEEGLSYRAAALGGAAGLALLWWILQAGGMEPWITGVFLGHYFLMMVVMGRVRAQLGAPSHQFYGAMPSWVLTTTVGTQAMGPRTQGMLYLLRPLLQEQRNHPMPNQLEALKMAEGGRMQRPRLVVVMALTSVVALLAYFWATVHTGFDLGMGTGHVDNWYTRMGARAVDSLRTNIESPTGGDLGGTLAIAISFVVTAVLYYLKLQFAWWPLHPVAYPISTSNTIAGIAPAIFITWLAKLLLLRYGGLRAHRTALPFFLGLLAGDATVSVLRVLTMTLTGKQL